MYFAILEILTLQITAIFFHLNIYPRLYTPVSLNTRHSLLKTHRKKKLFFNSFEFYATAFSSLNF